jgi:hypothetical protein
VNGRQPPSNIPSACTTCTRSHHCRCTIDQIRKTHGRNLGAKKRHVYCHVSAKTLRRPCATCDSAPLTLTARICSLNTPMKKNKMPDAAIVRSGKPRSRVRRQNLISCNKSSKMIPPQRRVTLRESPSVDPTNDVVVHLGNGPTMYQ